ncbi:18509_t:CDS:1, partial [Racocetra fulgida]
QDILVKKKARSLLAFMILNIYGNAEISNSSIGNIFAALYLYLKFGKKYNISEIIEKKNFESIIELEEGMLKNFFGKLEIQHTNNNAIE